MRRGGVFVFCWATSLETKASDKVDTGRRCWSLGGKRWATLVVGMRSWAFESKKNGPKGAQKAPKRRTKAREVHETETVWSCTHARAALLARTQPHNRRTRDAQSARLWPRLCTLPVRLFISFSTSGPPILGYRSKNRQKSPKIAQNLTPKISKKRRPSALVPTLPGPAERALTRAQSAPRRAKSNERATISSHTRATDEQQASREDKR